MKELMEFEGVNVRVIQDKNGEPLFELYSTGMALGYAKYNTVGKIYPRKDRIDKVVENVEISMCVHDGHKYLTESQLYDFMLEARTDKCKPFRKWVVNNVLPTIRKTGGFVAEGREEEFIYNHFPYLSDEVKMGMVRDLMEKNKQLQVNSDKYEQFMDKDGTFGFRDLCKHLNGLLDEKVKETEIRNLLKDKGIICKQGRKYVVSQEGVRQGYGLLKDELVNGSNRPSTRYTEKLRDYLIKELA